MKLFLALCVLAIGAAWLEAAPQRLQWKGLLQAATIPSSGIRDIWKDCGNSSDKAKIDTVTITPDPPERGKYVTVDAKLTIDEEVTGGDVTVDVHFNGIPIFDDTLDLCQLLVDAGHSCPVKAGPLEINVSEQIPSEVPPGKYVGNAVVKDQNGNRLLCANATVTLS